jgi:hypothetical protein
MVDEPRNVPFLGCIDDYLFTNFEELETPVT